MTKLTGLTIFFPVLNDRFIIPTLVEKAHKAAKKVARTYEIIIINDGSTDDSLLVTKNLQKKYPFLRVISHKKTQGYGSALRDGFSHATKDWVFYTDGDGQYDPSELTHLVEKVEPQVDIVNGYKRIRSDPWLRKLLGESYNRIVRFLYHVPIRDVDCDFRLIRREVLRHITLTSRSGLICVELVTKLAGIGARFTEVPVSHYPRRYGRSMFFDITPLFSTLREHITYYLAWKKNEKT